MTRAVEPLYKANFAVTPKTIELGKAIYNTLWKEQHLSWPIGKGKEGENRKKYKGIECLRGGRLWEIRYILDRFGSYIV